MKFTKYILLLVAMLMVQVSCDDGFDEINTNPNAANEINPNFQFSYCQLTTSGERYENWRAVLIYSSVMIQHFATTCGYWNGDKYTYNAGYSSSLYDRNYTNTIKNMEDLLNTLRNDPEADQAKLAMARIWRVVTFHRMTDMYGDVPYFDAGKGFLEGIDLPRYDPQSEIYADMLKELEEALAQLNGTGFGSADFVYGGDLEQWRRFGNSLMLRLGMRLSEVDPATAQATVSKAIAGGLMDSHLDDAFITHTNGPEGINMNGIGEVLDLVNGSGGDDCPRLSKTLVDWMSATGDPRLDVVGVPPVNGGPHRGLPNGLDAQALVDLGAPDTLTTDDFSDVNPAIVKVESPMMFMTYAETQFLMAEAILKGWASGDAATHYENGIRGAMKSWEHHGLTIPDADIDTYIANNPFDGTESQIGWQFWAATILNEYEAFSNWRRTGYPELVPVNFPGNVTNGQIPLRLAISQGEATTNSANWDEAKSRQGLGDDFGSHLAVPVWWDK